MAWEVLRVMLAPLVLLALLGIGRRVTDWI